MNEKKSIDKLKSAEISSPIHINNNWSAAKTAGICSGSGIHSDPYVIKDLVINGGGLRRCIFIEYTNAHFMILNCTLFNSKYPEDPFGIARSGIFLDHVYNGQLINNTCFSNEYGIFLTMSFSIIIKGNILYENEFGIYIDLGRYNEISNNKFYSTGLYGLQLHACDDSIVSRNLVTECNTGIWLQYCSRNTVSRNLVNNTVQGIYLTVCENSNVSVNYVSENTHSGIHLSESYNNEISKNTYNNNNFNGIFMVNSDFNSISRNSASNNEYGIYLDNSNNNTVSENKLFDNDVCIFEDSCLGNEFQDNLCFAPPKEDINNSVGLELNLYLIIGGVLVVGILVFKEIRKLRNFET
jgi:parallel beta-helix repeat protein